MQRLRVGTVPYLVARPLDLGLGGDGPERIEAPPARLVELLRNGELDVALVSSIELFRRRGYSYLSGLAVAGRGRVDSVQVFLRTPIERADRIALDPASRAAATLVRVALQPGFDDSSRETAPQFVEVPEGSAPEDAEADGFLRIGDRALRMTHAADALPTFNPSEAWARVTGLPFVFAVWIVRAGLEPDAGALEAFRAARERGRERMEELADDAARSWGLPLDVCRKYLFEQCLYEPGAGLEAAIARYRDEAAAIGLCDGKITPGVIEVPGVHVS